MLEIKKALLELGRIIILAIIPVLIDSLNKGYLDLRTLYVVGGLAALKFIDKLLHEYAPEGKAGGLTRF